MSYVFVNGELLAEEDARISTFDHGLVVGDGAFETVLLFDGRPFALRRHLARLNRSLAGLRLGLVDGDELSQKIDAVVGASGLVDGRIRITVTAGNGPLGSGRHDGPLSIIVAVSAVGSVHEHAQVATVPWVRNERGALVGLKTISYAENAVALAYAAERGAEEAIFANTVGNLCEGSGSNVFFVLDGQLCTPPLDAGCLAGITRGLVLELSDAKEHDLVMTAFHPGPLREAFLTSAVRGVQPIAMIDGGAFEVVPGPSTIAVMERYQRLRKENGNP